MTEEEIIRQPFNAKTLEDEIKELHTIIEGGNLIIELEIATNKEAEAYIKQLEAILDSYGIKYVKPKRLGQRN